MGERRERGYLQREAGLIWRDRSVQIASGKSLTTKRGERSTPAGQIAVIITDPNTKRLVGPEQYIEISDCVVCKYLRASWHGTDIPRAVLGTVQSCRRNMSRTCPSRRCIRKKSRQASLIGTQGLARDSMARCYMLHTRALVGRQLAGREDCHCSMPRSNPVTFDWCVVPRAAMHKVYHRLTNPDVKIWENARQDCILRARPWYIPCSAKVGLPLLSAPGCEAHACIKRAWCRSVLSFFSDGLSLHASMYVHVGWCGFGGRSNKTGARTDPCQFRTVLLTMDARDVGRARVRTHQPGLSRLSLGAQEIDCQSGHSRHSDPKTIFQRICGPH